MKIWCNILYLVLYKAPSPSYASLKTRITYVLWWFWAIFFSLRFLFKQKCYRRQAVSVVIKPSLLPLWFHLIISWSNSIGTRTICNCSLVGDFQLGLWISARRKGPHHFRQVVIYTYTFFILLTFHFIPNFCIHWLLKSDYKIMIFLDLVQFSVVPDISKYLYELYVVLTAKRWNM